MGWQRRVEARGEGEKPYAHHPAWNDLVSLRLKVLLPHVRVDESIKPRPNHEPKAVVRLKLC